MNVPPDLSDIFVEDYLNRPANAGFDSGITTEEPDAGVQPLHDIMNQLRQIDEYHSNVDAAHAGAKLLDRDNMEFLRHPTLVCPHVPPMARVIQNLDQVMPAPKQEVYSRDMRKENSFMVERLIDDQRTTYQSDDEVDDDIGVQRQGPEDQGETPPRENSLTDPDASSQDENDLDVSPAMTDLICDADATPIVVRVSNELQASGDTPRVELSPPTETIQITPADDDDDDHHHHDDHGPNTVTTDQLMSEAKVSDTGIATPNANDMTEEAKQTEELPQTGDPVVENKEQQSDTEAQIPKVVSGSDEQNTIDPTSAGGEGTPVSELAVDELEQGFDASSAQQLPTPAISPAPSIEVVPAELESSTSSEEGNLELKRALSISDFPRLVSNTRERNAAVAQTWHDLSSLANSDREDADGDGTAFSVRRSSSFPSTPRELERHSLAMKAFDLSWQGIYKVMGSTASQSSSPVEEARVKRAASNQPFGGHTKMDRSVWNPILSENRQHEWNRSRLRAARTKSGRTTSAVGSYSPAADVELRQSERPEKLSPEEYHMETERRFQQHLAEVRERMRALKNSRRRDSYTNLLPTRDALRKQSTPIHHSELPGREEVKSDTSHLLTVSSEKTAVAAPQAPPLLPPPPRIQTVIDETTTTAASIPPKKKPLKPKYSMPPEPPGSTEVITDFRSVLKKTGRLEELAKRKTQNKPIPANRETSDRVLIENVVVKPSRVIDMFEQRAAALKKGGA